MTTATQSLPQFESVHRVMGLPVVELALSKSASTYSRVKGYNQLLGWALGTAETSLYQATKQAAPYVNGPLVGYVDHTLCRGLDAVESRIPIVKEQPEIILERSYMLAIDAISRISVANDYFLSHASHFKKASFDKMNEMLSTEYGLAGVNAVDSTAHLVETLIDKYFPPIGEETFPESVSIEDDKLRHTIQTIGRLSNKAARRVFVNVSHRLRTMRKENLRAYLANILEFLHLARYIHAQLPSRPSALALLPASPNSSSNSTAIVEDDHERVVVNNKKSN